MNTIPMPSPSLYDKRSSDEQLLYDFLIKAVQSDSPETILEDFRVLFVEAREGRHPQMYLALERLVRDRNIDQFFNNFFNRCCHIVINHWQMQPQTQRFIPQLVEQFQKSSSHGGSSYNAANRIRQLVRAFTQSEQFVKIQRIANIVSAKQVTVGTTSVGTLINRYPYLYDHCLLGDDSSYEHRQTVRRIKVQTERKFEVNLSRYVTYKVRMVQSQHSGLILPQTELINPVKNPTLLSDNELNKSLKQFVGRVEDGKSYKAVSQSFSNHVVHTQTFGAFKDELYDYVLASLDDRYRKGQFNRKLYDLFQHTMPECDQQRPTEFLQMRISSQLLNFLIVESVRQPEHYVFIDLISNMGVTRTIGLFLKIILFCKKVRPYVEKRFSILFNHYESFSREGVPWLVKSLENMQLAFSVHFGKVDLSGLKQTQLLN
ncbi:MAG: hypothetical protein ACKN9E_18605 [Microcystaceae cyanobacterium]